MPRLVGSEANAVAPGARPLSSMSPTVLVSPDGQQRIVVGASGGPFIITSTLQVILNIVDFDLDPSEAVAAPRFHHQWQPESLFLDQGFTADTVRGLEARGHGVREMDFFSAVQVIHQTGTETMLGASDPRKGGWPAGFAEPVRANKTPTRGVGVVRKVRFSCHVGVEVLAAAGHPELANGLELDLADAFPREVEAAADFFEAVVHRLPEAVAHPHHGFFAGGERGERMAELVGQGGHVVLGAGGHGVRALDEVSDSAVGLVGDGVSRLIGSRVSCISSSTFSGSTSSARRSRCGTVPGRAGGTAPFARSESG